jgi:hypothetical protein
LVGPSRLGASSQEDTLIPLLSRKPGEGVNGSRTYKGLFGAEIAEHAEILIIRMPWTKLFMAVLLRGKIPKIC